MKTKPQITAAQAAELEQRTLANVIEKISAGAVPTNREIEMLKAATASPATNDDRWPEGKVAEWLDLSRQRCEQLAREGVIPSPNADGWEAMKCVVAYIRKLRERQTDEGRADRARREKAEADMAEMESARMEGTLVRRVDYANDMQDGIARGVTAISRLKTLSTAQKAQVFAALRSVKMPKTRPDEKA